jgi:hypothetical protein
MCLCGLPYANRAAILVADRQAMQLYISGLHSGLNPLPGVGICRSVRSAYPEAEIIGVDYSADSSGLHWPEFNRVIVPGSFDSMDFDQYADWILKRLDEGAYWISGLDLEIALLQNSLKGHPNFLGPSTACLEQIAKPAAHAGSKLGFNIPNSIPLSASDGNYVFDIGSAMCCGPLAATSESSAAGAPERCAVSYM